jgi:hypothetical protein
MVRREKKTRRQRSRGGMWPFDYFYRSTPQQPASPGYPMANVPLSEQGAEGLEAAKAKAAADAAAAKAKADADAAAAKAKAAADAAANSAAGTGLGGRRRRRTRKQRKSRRKH